jgi:hypothetical protein
MISPVFMMPSVSDVLQDTHRNHIVGLSCACDYSATHSPPSCEISTDEEGAAVKNLRDAFFPGGPDRASSLQIFGHSTHCFRCIHIIREGDLPWIDAPQDLALIVARKLQKND